MYCIPVLLFIGFLYQVEKVENMSSFIQLTYPKDLITKSVVEVRHEDHSDDHNETDQKTSTVTGIFIAIGAWFLLTISGFLGFILIPLKKHPAIYEFTLQFLNALGFSSMLGDVVFHLIPHGLAGDHKETIHSHNHSHHNHEHNVGKFSVILFGIVFMYFVEVVLKIAPLTRKRECGCHHRDEIKEKKETIKDPEIVYQHNHHECVNIETARDIQSESRKHRLGSGVPPDVTVKLMNTIEVCPGELEEKFDREYETEIIGDCSTVKEAKSVVLSLIFADMCHHVFDGLAIGSIFVQGTNAAILRGLSTWVSIFFHEFPHKAGDMALLVKSGYSEKKATLFVVLTSSVSIIGLIIGCVTSVNSSRFSVYVELFTAGMFIYISLVLMMSQMLNDISKPDAHLWKTLLAHFLGMSLGVILMFVLSKYH